MRTDTIEYFQNIKDGIQTAPAKEIATEALAAIAELVEEAQKIRDARMHDVANRDL
jgi:hypothetical protein